MFSRDWRYFAALGGLATVLAVWLTWWYALPQQPRISSYEASQGPERGYQPGGAACDPKRLNILPPKEAPAERDRCAQAREDHRVQQAELAQAARANDLAERNLRLAYEQARIAFTQTIATVLAFIAAGVAAVFAGLAVYHSKRSADADNDALAEARASAVDARKEAVEQAKRVTEQLRLTDQTMEFTAKSAYAMSDTARETRRFAAAMQTSAEAAKQSADAATSGALAAQETAKVARATGRAYVFTGTSAIVREADGRLKVSVVMENAGTSPALIKSLYYKVYFSRPEGEITLFEPDGKYTETDIAVPARSIKDAFEFYINPQTRPPYVYCLICYEDIYREYHVSKSCVRIIAASLTTVVDGSPAWNEWD